jgi:hypothetical protein
VTAPTLPQSAETRQPELAGIFPANSPIARYLAWTTAAHGSPLEYNVAVAVTAGVHELARRGFRLPKVVDVGEYPLAVWIVLLGESATGKSTALSAGQDFLRHCWNAAGVAIDPDPWIEPEGSPQGLVTVLQEHYDEQRSTTVGLLYHHEFAAMLQSREAIGELICKLSDGRTMELNFLNRKKAKTPNADRLINPRVSALLCTTEQQLLAHFKQAYRFGGLFTRLIWEVPTFTRDHIRLSQDHAGAQSARQLRDDAVDSTVGWFASLDLMGSQDGYDFKFTAEGHAVLEDRLFRPWREAYTSRVADENMHGVRMRLVEKARVFAALHASWRGQLEIKPVDVEFAVQLAQHYHSQVARVSHFGTSDIYQKIQQAEEMVRSAADIGCYRRDLYKRLKCDKKTLDTIVETLIDNGLVFHDWRMESAGRLIHASTDAGAKAREHAEAKLHAKNRAGEQPWRRG